MIKSDKNIACIEGDRLRVLMEFAYLNTLDTIMHEDNDNADGH